MNIHKEMFIESKEKLYKYVKLNLIKKSNFNIKDTIIVSSSPRSGSTWFMEMLSVLTDYTYIFEPLHYGWFPDSKFHGFSPRTFIETNAYDEFKYKYLEEVFKGKHVSNKPMYKNFYDLIKSNYKKDKLIVKFVRANRFLPWICNNYDLRAVFLLTRHPCAVIESQLRTGTKGYNLLDNLYPSSYQLSQEAKETGMFNNKLIKKINNVDTAAEKLAVIWALDNYIPLYDIKNKQVNYDNLFIIKYEDLINNRLKEGRKILELLGEDNIEYKLNLLKTRSEKYSMTSEDKKDDYLLKWKNRLKEKEIKNIRKVLEWFGIYFNDRNYEIRGRL